ncbi:dTDP-4-dehydrorhamnose reductase [Novosphingobium ginsenosidimutans]|uniref:dTDP-4-dehydrorhamnose reductase n=1 Tax=Novosphingobium ginsenosidimutans TaxID=1176536 RepID=A0A5B8S373_9SPHN|nr:dTDP-4-dehydrorhamnose reductase [Novosphingobium ginsenosidimutans]QEA15830.1 dTDP-4-dehydrorhamnose reductase [Novosphingobium ginsenosidimutans]
MSGYTVLVTGGTGQVGLELLRQSWPADVTVLAPARDQLDLASGDSIAAWFASREVHCIINPAAYTAVDLAEDNVGAAFLANAQGPAWLADIARQRDIPLLHVSTDYVFDGSLDRPYHEEDPVSPLGAYGASKLAGELAVRAGAPRHVILRTAWVISAQRNNFLKTMLRLAAERPELSVVADQHGCPTSARDIAATLRTIALAHLADGSAPSGTYHFVNDGSTTWHGLAEAVMAASRAHGGAAVPVRPIASADFPTRARRPGNSRLGTAKIRSDFGIAPRPWQDIVEQIVSELSLPSPKSEKLT